MCYEYKTVITAGCKSGFIDIYQKSVSLFIFHKVAEDTTRNVFTCSALDVCDSNTLLNQHLSCLIISDLYDNTILI